MSRAARNSVTALLIAAGVVFVVIGALRGEAAVVLQKAIRVCLECIGIG